MKAMHLIINSAILILSVAFDCFAQYYSSGYNQTYYGNSYGSYVAPAYYNSSSYSSYSYSPSSYSYYSPSSYSYSSYNYNSYSPSSYSYSSYSYSKPSYYSSYSYSKPTYYSSYTKPSTYYSSEGMYDKPTYYTGNSSSSTTTSTSSYLYGKDNETEQLAKKFYGYYDAKNYAEALKMSSQINVNKLKNTNEFDNCLLYCYYNQKRYKEGISYYEKWKKYITSPNINLIADLYYLEGRYAEAIPFYKQSPDINKINTVSRNIALSYYNIRDYENAIYYFDKYFSLGGDHNWNRVLKGSSLINLYYPTMNKGQTALALSYIEKAINILDEAENKGGTFFEIYAYRCEAHYYKGNYDLCIKDGMKAHSIKSDYISLSFVGAAYFEKKDYAKSLDYFNQALALKPEDDFSLNGRAYTKCFLKDYKGALADSDKAIAAKPDFSNYYDTRGYAKYHLADYKGALVDFDKAVSLFSNHYAALTFRGLTKQKLGDKSGACDDLKKAAILEKDARPAFTERATRLIDDYCK